jgi:hypothetical protein
MAILRTTTGDPSGHTLTGKTRHAGSVATLTAAHGELAEVLDTADRKEAKALLAKWHLETHRERQWDEQPTRSFDQLLPAYLLETENSKRSPKRIAAR